MANFTFRNSSGITKYLTLALLALLAAILTQAESLAVDPQTGGDILLAKAKEKSESTLGNPSADPLSEARALISQGTRCYEGAQFDQALDYYEQAQARNPQSSPSLKDLIRDTRTYLDYQRALKAGILSANRNISDDVREKYRASRSLFDQEQYDMARKGFIQVWVLAGDYEDSLEYLKKIAQTYDDRSVAAKPAPAAANPEPHPVEKAIANAAANPEPRPVEKAIANVAANPEPRPVEKAIADVAPVAPVAPVQTTIDPKTFDMKLKQADTLLRAGAHDQAEALYANLLKQDPADKSARKGLDKTREARVKTLREKALAERQAADKALGDKVEASMANAEMLGNAGKFDPAIAMLDNTLLLDPGNRDLASQIALLQKKKAQTAASQVKAEQDLQSQADKQLLEKARSEDTQRAKQIQTTQKEQAAQIAFVLKEAKTASKAEDYLRASALYTTVLERDAKNLEALEGKKEAETAIQLAQVESERQKANAQILAQNKIKQDKVALLEQGQQDEIQRRQQDDATRAEAIDNQLKQGQAAYEDRQYAQAAKNFQTVLNIEPSNPAAITGLDKSHSELSLQTVREQRENVAKQSQTTAEVQLAEKAKRDVQTGQLFAEGKEAESRGDICEAMELYESILALNPEHASATYGLNRTRTAWNASLSRIVSGAEPGQPAPAIAKMTRETQKMLIQADRHYAQKGKGLETAREIWAKILEADPGNKIAETYLEESAQAYTEYLDQAKRAALVAKREAEGRQKIQTPVTVSTTEPGLEPPLLSDFLETLSVMTGISFNISTGREAIVTSSFIDKPLDEVLDIVLSPLGLKWERINGDVVQITGDMKEKIFNLTTGEVEQIQKLMASKSLQRILYGDDMKPLKAAQLQLDERERALIIVDSQANIDKLAAFLADMRLEESIVIITKIYVINKANGPAIKANVEIVMKSLSRSQNDEFLNLERMVLLAGDKLIVRDTQPNIDKIEELLKEQLIFTEGKDSIGIDVEVFDIKKDGELLDPESVPDRIFFQNIYDTIETLLYATGLEAARAKGRQLLPAREDLATVNDFQLTLLDYKENIRRVSNYIGIVTGDNQDERKYIVDLKYQLVQDMVSELNAIYGLEDSGASSGTDSTLEKTFTLSNPEKEYTFRDCTIRLLRVQNNQSGGGGGSSGSSGSSGGGNTGGGDNRSECELSIRTATSSGGSNTTNIREFESEVVDDYEIQVTKIRVGGGKAGGRVTVRVRYAPTGDTLGNTLVNPGPLGTGNLTLGPDGLPIPGLPTTTQEEVTQLEGLSWTAMGSLNKLIITYDDPAKLQEVLDLIEELDKATPQVSIETRFVTVYEERAKEHSMRLSARDRQDPRNLIPTQTTTQSPDPANPGSFITTIIAGPTLIDTFTQDVANWASIDYGLAEGKLPDVFGKSISWDLSMLEEEGVIHFVNGPHITVMDGETSDFEIQAITVNFQNQSGGGNNQQNQQNQLQPQPTTVINNTTVVNPDGTTSDPTQQNQQNNLLNQQNQNQNQQLNYSTLVLLSVQPEITSEDSIILEIDVEINDRMPTPVSGLGMSLWDERANLPNLNFLHFGFVRGSAATVSLPGARKLLTTRARVRDGGTIVLGGWAGELEENYESGIPGLSDIPWIGPALFTHKVHTKTRTNLLVFLSADLLGDE